MEPTQRRCLKEPIDEILEASQLLRYAVSAHLKGDRARAADLFTHADMRAVREWTESIWAKETPEIHRIRAVQNSPPYLPKVARIKVRMPSSREQAVLITHYGHKCAFCGIPLVRKAIRERAVNLYPESVSWGRTNLTQHAAFQAMWLQFDHIVPHSRGGDNSMDNMIVTCAPCNFGRMSHTLDEMGLIDPRGLSVTKADWDGLEKFN